MRCHICNKKLTVKEVRYETKYKQWAPCNRCIKKSRIKALDLEEEQDFYDWLMSSTSSIRELNDDSIDKQ